MSAIFRWGECREGEDLWGQGEVAGLLWDDTLAPELGTYSVVFISFPWYYRRWWRHWFFDRSWKGWGRIVFAWVYDPLVTVPRHGSRTGHRFIVAPGPSRWSKWRSYEEQVNEERSAAVLDTPDGGHQEH